MNTKDWVFTRKNLHFEKGDAIFNEQDEGKEMYFIESGEIKIMKTIGDIDVNIAFLCSGAFFGEMSLITESRRVASAIAITDCNLHVMDRFLLTLARRLEDTDVSFTNFFKLISNSSKSSKP